MQVPDHYAAALLAFSRVQCSLYGLSGGDLRGVLNGVAPSCACATFLRGQPAGRHGGASLETELTQVASVQPSSLASLTAATGESL